MARLVRSGAHGVGGADDGRGRPQSRLPKPEWHLHPPGSSEKLEQMASPDTQVALVTGAAGDIGKAITSRLVERGVEVWAVDVLEPSDASQRIPRHSKVHYLQVDVTQRQEVDAAIALPARLDAVVGNAGIVEPEPFLSVEVESWERHLRTNLTGNFHVAQAAARRFRADSVPGKIVFTGSWVGERPWPEIAPYSVTKAGLVMLARSMALELAVMGIRVNVVAPGIVNAGLARQEAERNPEYAALAAVAVPLGHLQEPEDVAAMVSFLLGPDADNITGATFVVDGGCSIRTT